MLEPSTQPLRRAEVLGKHRPVLPFCTHSSGNQSPYHKTSFLVLGFLPLFLFSLICLWGSNSFPTHNHKVFSAVLPDLDHAYSWDGNTEPHWLASVDSVFSREHTSLYRKRRLFQSLVTTVRRVWHIPINTGRGTLPQSRPTVPRL